MRDPIVLDALDLRPIAFDDTRGGVKHVRLTYAGRRITGTKGDKAVTSPIALTAPGAVGESNLYGVDYGAMPLQQGAKFEVPFYRYDKGFGRSALTVTNCETVTTAAASAEAWVVAVNSGGSVRASYLS